jgi:UDP-glucose 4-epimerase
MRVVVTGSSGFIGNAVVEQLLTTNHEVCVITNSDSANKNQRVKCLFYKHSLMECEQALKSWKPECFFHFAWLGVGSDQRNNKENNLYNYKLAVDSVKLAANTGCFQWICSGSQAEYGIVNEKLSEENICLPTSEYGITKKIIYEETIIQCKKLGLIHTWARLFSAYGPGDHPNTFISYLVKSMLHQKDVEVSSCNQMWDYLYINDVASAFCSLIKHEGVFNIASGKVIQLKDIVVLTCELTDFKGKIYWHKKNDGFLNYLCGDIKKIKQITKWIPKVDLKDGLQNTIKTYQLIK